MSKEYDTQSDLLLKFHYIDEESTYESFFKVYSYLDSLESCKKYEEETPVYIEIANEDSYENNGLGFALTIEQTKELIKVLQQAINYLEN